MMARTILAQESAYIWYNTVFQDCHIAPTEFPPLSKVTTQFSPTEFSQTEFASTEFTAMGKKRECGMRE